LIGLSFNRHSAEKCLTKNIKERNGSTRSKLLKQFNGGVKWAVAEWVVVWAAVAWVEWAAACKPRP
jgi:hypothetical protein